MKKLITSISAILLFAGIAITQPIKMTMSVSEGQICVQAVPQFTDATACLNGGDIVVISPIGVPINSITSVFGGWVPQVLPLEFMGVTVQTFTSATVANFSAISGQPFDLICFNIPPECTEGEIRLLEQIDHLTPVDFEPDFSIYGNAQHTFSASFNTGCNPSVGTVFDGNVMPIVTYDCAQAMPVEFLSFTAKKYGSTRAMLEWATASETNNEYFSVERSRTGQFFEPIGKIAGAGNSSQVLEYSFIDAAPFDGKNYYRVVQYDYDGTNVPTPIRVVRFDEGNSVGTLDIFPNPSYSGLFIRYQTEKPSNSPLQAVLYDNLGRTVYTGDFDTELGQKFIDYTKFNITSGVFILQLRNGEEIFAQEKVIVQRSR